MDKIKNFLNPGKAADDEILYGSGRSNDPVHSGNTGALSGEGSHFDNSRDSPSGIGIGSSNIGSAPTTAGPHSSDLANRADPRVDSDLDGSRTAGNTTGAYSSTGRSSMPGAFEPDSNPYSSQELDPRLGGPTTTGVGSNTAGSGYGTTGQQTGRDGQQTGYASQRTTGTNDSHLGRDAAALGTAGAVGEGIHHHRENERGNLGTSSNTTRNYGDNAGVGNTSSTTAAAGPHDSSLLNKLDPRVDSSTSGTVDNTGSGPHYGRDAAAVGGTAAVGEGIHHHRENERGNLGTSSNTPRNYGDNSATGNASSNASAGPHSSSLLNKLDPRVDSTTGTTGTTGNTGTTGSNTSHHYGRDAAVGAGGVGLAEHEHRKHEHERDNLGTSTTSSGTYGGNSGIGNTGSNTTHHYGRDAAVGTGGVGLAEHEHRKHERERDNLGTSTTASGTYGDNSGIGSTGSNTTAGPHSSSLLNKLDPRVDSNTTRATDNTSGTHYGRDATAGASGVGLAEHEHRKHEREREGDNLGASTNTAGTYGGSSGIGNTGSNTTHHYGRDAAVGAGGAGLAEHEHRKHEHERERERDNVGASTNTAGTYGQTSGMGSTGSNTTTGPHKSSLLNKLDPRVDSSTSGTVDNTNSGPHYGRDAAAVGGAAAVGEGVHHHRQNERDNLGTSGYSGTTPSGTGSGYYSGPAGTGVSGMSGPHTTATANRLDPAVNTSGRSIEDSHLHDPLTGGGGETADAAHGGNRHHLGRDAALGGGGVGLAEHEHRKHEREREAGMGSSTGIGSNTGAYGDNSSYGGTTGTGAGPHSSSLLNKLDPRVDSTTGTTGTTGATGSNTSHHYGRDAAVGAGGVGLAEHEHRKHERERETGVGSTAGSDTNTGAYGTSTTGTGSNTGAYGGSTSGIGSNTGAHGGDRGYGNTTGSGSGPHSSSLLNKLDPRVDSSTTTATGPTGTTGSNTSHHYGRDAAVGAGGVGLAEHEHRKHEREREGQTGVGSTTSSGSNTGAYGTSTTGMGSNTGAYGDNSAYGNPSGATTGPHNSSLLNKLDPRVDSTSGTTDNTGSTHHYGRDAAVGAGGVGLAEHEHRKHERERETGVGSTTGLGSNTGAYSDNRAGTTGNTSHHYGRDAAVGAGGAGLAEHEHRKREHEREREAGAGGTTGVGSSTGTYGDNSYDNTTGTATGPHKSSLLNKLDPRVDSTTGTTDTTGTSSHHHGRDAAAGAGGVGLAEHEHRKHEREREAGVGNTGIGSGSTGMGSSTGTYGNDPRDADTTGTSGHHYGRDAAVGAGGLGLAEHEHRKHERERETGIGNTGIGSTTGTSGTDSAYPDRTATSGHHYGRDAAVGAGGVGLAEHEHRKHEQEREPGLGGSTGTTSGAGYATGPAPNTAGPHSKDWMNKLDPRVNSDPTAAYASVPEDRGTSHVGRDAAVGTGLVGAAGYEAEKHHHSRNEPGVGGAYDEGLPNLHHTGRDASAIGAATALDENEKSRLRAGRGERDNDYNQGPVEPGYGSTTTGTTHGQRKDHHLGRDAAGAGVVGGAAYEAEKHHKHDKDLTAAEREQKRELKHEEKEQKRELKEEKKEEKKHHGLLSFLHRDKNKKYTKEEEDEFDRQERESRGHTGRDAAIGGAAVGGAAYEAEKHHGHHHTGSGVSGGEPDVMKPLPIAPGNHGIGTGEGTQNALLERKRGEGYNDPALGTGATLASGGDPYQTSGTAGVNDGLTGTGYGTSTGTTGTHHLGRDAAVGAGGVGLAEHEHHKHEQERGAGIGGTSGTGSNAGAYGGGASGTGSNTGAYGDNSAYGNTSGSGAGPHSSSLLNKLDPRVDSTTGTTTGTTGTTSGYGTNEPAAGMTGSNTQSTGYAGQTGTKHNVLHKDPPPNHPAARAMGGDGTYPQDTTGTGNY